MRRQAVLVLIHGNKWVEVYGPHSVTAKIIALPETNGPMSEIAMEEHVGRIVPLRYKDIYYPSNLCSSEMCCQVSLAEWARKNQATKNLLEAIHRLETNYVPSVRQAGSNDVRDGQQGHGHQAAGAVP